MKKKSTLFLMLLILFLCVIVAFIGYFYFETLRVSRANLRSVVKTNLTYVQSRLEGRQQEIEDGAAMLLVNQKIKDLEKDQTDLYNYDYLEKLTEIRQILKERLIDTEVMSSISIYWPKSGTFISTDSKQDLKRELMTNKLSSNGWRMAGRGLYYAITSTFDREKGNEIVVMIHMADALLLDSESLLTADINGEVKSMLVLPDGTTIGNDPDFQASVVTYLDRETPVKSSLTIANRKGYLISQTSAKSGIQLVSFLPQNPNEHQFSAIALAVILLTAFVLIFGFFLVLLFYRNVVTEVNLLISKFQQVEQGDYETRITTVVNNEFNYLFEQFNVMIGGIQKLVTSLQKEIKFREQAEARQFRSQIQPHFLYNSLFYIVSVADNPRAVKEMTRHLAEYYRYLTKKNDNVTVADELSFAQHYLTIQALRKDFQFSMTIDPQIDQLTILPLLIQPIIENAIEHGIEAREGANRIEVTGELVGDWCQVTISDDGPGLTLAERERLAESLEKGQCEDKQQSVGLWNVNRRLINFYGKQAKIKLLTNGYGGLSVSFQFKEEEIK